MSAEKIVETKGIFSFDEHTYIWSWFLVPGKRRDVLGCLFRQKEGAEITYTYRFRYYATDDPFDKQDVKRVYHASWPPTTDPNIVLVKVRAQVAVIADEYGHGFDELVVNGGVDRAVEVLGRHQAVHMVMNGPGGDA